MDTNARGHIRAAFLVLTLTVVGLMTTFIGMNPVGGAVEGQTPRSGCQFQIFLRPPIEFAGPAGGADFELHNPHRDGAGIQVTNAYGTQSCSWNASVNQNWVTLSISGGTLEPEGDNVATVSINDNAAHLSRGIHRAKITFTSRQDPQPTLKKQIEVTLYAQEPCDLQILGGTYRARALLGEVPGEISRATLNNGGDAPCHWQAHSDVSWLTVTPTAGTVLPRSPQHVSIQANEGAKNLVPDDYEATVLLQWRETRDEFLEIDAKLEIDPPPCELHFEPRQSFTASGRAGSGEFSPVQGKFVLENLGGDPCYYWQASGEPEWIEIAGEDETIGGKSQTDVVVRINQQATAEIRPGTYDYTLRFASGVASAEHGLAVSLDVQPLPCQLEIVDEELNFTIKPEGLIQSETELPFKIHNSWTNEACQWTSESNVDWLTSEPTAGTLAGGETATVTAKIVQSDGFAKLDAGAHEAKLGLTVANGTADEPLPVEIKIDCKAGEPCAYLHTSHTKTEVLKPAEISLTLYNPNLARACDLPRDTDNPTPGPSPTPCIDDGRITAQLLAEVPSGWEVSIGNLADRCSGICNRTYTIIGGEQEFIELIAIPNNEGIFDFAATVYWGGSESVQPGNGESEDDRKSSKLRAQVEVTDPSAAGQPPVSVPPGAGAAIVSAVPTVEVAADVAEQITNRIAPTLVSQAQAAVEEAAATQEPDDQSATISQPVDPGQSTTSTDPQVGWQSGVSAQWMILGIAVVVVVFIAAIVGAILIGFRWLANAQRRMPPSESAPGSE